MQTRSLRNTIDDLVRNERTPLLAVLIAQINDIGLAEDVLQDAITKAWVKWPESGIPDNPKSWLLRVAYNRAIDYFRKQQNFKLKQQQITHLIELQHELNASMDDELIPDERLKLIFTCCHPALNSSNQVALTLNTICGFTTEQIANAQMLKLTTMAQRLVRAKRKIKLSGIPYQIPQRSDLPNRLNSVLVVIYLIYNAGYYSNDRPQLTNLDQTDEAFYLAKTLNELMPDQAEVLGLLALMSFHQSRIKARNQHQDHFISLEQQDRSLWQQELIKTANQWFTQAIACKKMGPYQIQAAISGVHSKAISWHQTDWPQIVALYHKLLSYLPTDTVRINLAVAMSYAGDAEKAWACLNSVDRSSLKNYLPFHLAQAQIAKSVNQPALAVSHFSLAMALSKNPQEKAFLQTQIDSLSAS